MDPTLLNNSKYSGGILKAVTTASWNGAGAQSVILVWIFLIVEAMQAEAMAHPTLQPDRQHTNSEAVWFEHGKIISWCQGKDNEYKDRLLQQNMRTKVLDNEDVIIVRFCIPGSETRVTCFSL